MKRDTTIDFLRGLGILGMILIHTSYYFLSDHVALFLWNWSEVAVPVFIYCSAYLYFSKASSVQRLASRDQKTQKDSTMSLRDHEVARQSRGTQFNLEYFKKRTIRLLKPYYIFLIFFIPLVFITERNVVSVKYIVESILTIGGVDISWLVLLFLELMIIMPSITRMRSQKNTIQWISYIIAAFSFSALLLFGKFGFNYRWIMWLPYSVLLIFVVWEIHGSLFIADRSSKEKERVIPVKTGIQVFVHSSFIPFLLFLFIFLASMLFLKSEGRSLSFYDNKYPPNLYFLAYGIVGVVILKWISRFIPSIIQKFIHFFSVYSYPIFFIHYFLLYIAVHYLLPKVHFEWWSFYLIVLIPTAAIQLGINKIFKKSSKAS